jgi:hypothetical protein
VMLMIQRIVRILERTVREIAKMRTVVRCSMSAFGSGDLRRQSRHTCRRARPDSSDVLPPILQMMISGHFKYIWMRGPQLRGDQIETESPLCIVRRNTWKNRSAGNSESLPRVSKPERRTGLRIRPGQERSRR